MAISYLILLLFGVAQCVVIEDIPEKCRDTRHGVDSGLVRVPDFQENVPANVTCSWAFTAPTGKKLLVKVDSVHYPPTDARDTSLKLYLDEEIVDIPRNCVRCLKQLVTGHSVRVLYSSVATYSSSVMDLDLDGAENGLFADMAGSFQIRYKAFDPSICDRPRAPANGQATVTNRKIGHEVQYRCNPPYDLFGKSSAVCQIPTDSPVPEWSNGPPKCGVSNCSNVPVARQADSVVPGAIASPGYPNFKLRAAFDCEWVITAAEGYQITSFLSFLELSDKEGHSVASLRLFDGRQRTLINADHESLEPHHNVTTKSNVLTVTFKTNNTAVAEGGFYLNYVAVAASCPEPEVPENGELVGYSYAVGSTIAFLCLPGYVMDGVPGAECLVNAIWSHPTPACVNVTNDTVYSRVGNASALTTVASLLPESTSLFSPIANATAEDFTGFNSPISAKVTKPSKKTKLFPTTKIPSKSTTVKPKTKSQSPHDFLPSELVPAASPINETQTEGKTPRTSENGILEKNSRMKSIADSKEKTLHAEKYDDDDHDVPHYDEFNPFEDPSSRLPSTAAMPKEKKVGADGEEDMTRMTTYILIGVGAGCLLVIICAVVVLVIYRKRFPVRMRFGRKFSTFENPMYVANKEQDAQHPRELKRLTV